jgi:hypothetical protein
VKEPFKFHYTLDSFISWALFLQRPEEAMDSDDEDFVTEKRKKTERGKQEDFVQINFPSGHCLGE